MHKELKFFVKIQKKKSGGGGWGSGRRGVRSGGDYSRGRGVLVDGY